MNKPVRYIALMPIYTMILIFFLLAAFLGSRAVDVIVLNSPIANRHTVVIDAGHGAPDGGATSCTGVLESHYNLEIALRLNDLMHLLGIDTVMIRDTDESVYTEGETIAQKKISDLKERVRIVNTTNNAVLVSIHQNTYPESKYNGAQIFYGGQEGSRQLAERMQAAFISSVNPSSRRQSKPADGIYLLQNITAPGVLVECGFLSNPQEAYSLGNTQYQQKICSVIACTVSMWLFDT